MAMMPQVFEQSLFLFLKKCNPTFVRMSHEEGMMTPSPHKTLGEKPAH